MKNTKEGKISNYSWDMRVSVYKRFYLGRCLICSKRIKYGFLPNFLIPNPVTRAKHHVHWECVNMDKVHAIAQSGIVVKIGNHMKYQKINTDFMETS